MLLTPIVVAALPLLSAPQAGVRAVGVAARGEELLTELRCVACHAPEDAWSERLPLLPAPSLTGSESSDGVGKRARASWIAAHLAEPGDEMPDLLGGLPAAEREAAANELLAYLVSLGGPFEDGPVPILPARLERGRQLYHSIGCVACHAPLEVPEDLELPLWSFEGGLLEDAAFDETFERSLTHLPDKTGHEALARFLLDPRSTRPSGEMPSLGLSESEAQALAQYLTLREVRADGPGFDYAPGLIYEYFETDNPAKLEGVMPVRAEVVENLDELPEHRPDHFSFRFRGFVLVPEGGRWTFYTTSDDGSRLYVDDELVVDNWGNHPMRERSGEVNLIAGRHAIEVVMYEQGGGEGLEVAWAGPGLPKGAIPSSALRHWARVSPPDPRGEEALEPALVARGAERFRALGCSACHDADDEPAPGKRLRDLDALAPGGCLDEAPKAGLPRYELDAADRGHLRAALAARYGFSRPLTPGAKLQRTLNRLDCYACHERDGRGGPSDDHLGYFRVEGDLDLGDEGRLPPTLDHVGWKLLPHALDGVLTQGEAVRPYMLTRMPQFGAEHVGTVAALLSRIDGRPSDPPPLFSADEVDIGRSLAGTNALGCIQCHDLAGHKGLGIPAVDLATVGSRIDPSWFRTLLLDPWSIRMGSRMPSFFPDGESPAKDLHGGDPARQTDALWSWLSLGSSMPLPEGLVVDEGEYELVPIDRPITVGVFFKDASARTVLVGFPERLGVAFDVESSRLTRAWRGRFFNAEGTWHGRAGKLEDAMGQDVLAFPDGVPFARLDADDAEWPTRSADDVGYRVRGRRVAPEGDPIFRYELDGVEIDERVLPKLGPGGATLTRSFQLSSDGAGWIHFRAATGERIEALPDGEFRVDDDQVLSLRGPANLHAVVHEGPAGAELRIAVPLSSQPTLLEVDVRW
ncbi:MAG: PA14 domain-containing protein [Planctomycetota bacterium]